MNARFGSTSALAYVCGSLAAAIGISVLLGWHGELIWLGGAVADGPEIRPVTGACLLVLGLALIVARRLRRGALTGIVLWLWAPAYAGAVLAAAWLLARLFLNAGGSERPTSPHTFISMVLLGLAILMSVRAESERRRASMVLALAGAAVPWLALLGYATSVPFFYTVPGAPEVGMSVMTSITLLIVSVGVMGLWPEHGFVALGASGTEGGTLLRVLLPVAVLFPVVAGGLLNYGQAAGWFNREVGLALNLSVTSVIFIGLVLWIGMLFKRREAERRAAESELQKLQSGLVTVCAWTQRVLDEGKWVQFEEFLAKRLHISVSHGISEGAAQSEAQDLIDFMNQETPSKKS